jgi:hypothetical protein
MLYRIQDDLLLRPTQVAPLPRPLETIEADPHHLEPMQAHHSEAEGLAHAPYLPIATLGERDAKGLRACPLHLAWSGQRRQSLRRSPVALGGRRDHHTSSELSQVCVAQRAAAGDVVVLLVVEGGAVDAVWHTPVARQQNEALRVLVEPAHWKDPFPWAADCIDEIALYSLVCGAGDATGLPVFQVRVIIRSALAVALEGAFKPGAIQRDDIPSAHTVSGLCELAIDLHTTGGDDTVGFSPRELCCEHLVDADTSWRAQRRARPQEEQEEQCSHQNLRTQIFHTCGPPTV